MTDTPAPTSRTFGERLRSNPVATKELRTRMRGRRAFVLLTAYLLLLSIVVAGVYLVYQSSNTGVMSVQSRQTFGKAIFSVVVFLELLTISFIAPALTAGAISNERENQTYDLLRTTLLPARALVIGKFGSALLYLLLLIFAAVPLQSLAFLFGGVAFEEIAIGSLMLVTTASAFCAAGMFFSSLVRRTLVSTVLAYGFALLLVLGVPTLMAITLSVAAAATNGMGSMSAITEFILISVGWAGVSINPLAAAVASEVILLEEQSLTHITYYMSNNSNQLLLISPWIPYVLFYSLLSIVLLAASIRLVRRAEK